MILVSACLLGKNVKYNGGNNANALIIKYGKYLTPVCPECLGKLSIPHPPAELQGGDGYQVIEGKAKVVNKEGLDVTDYFRTGAQRVLDIALQHKVKYAILKANSPSCGNTMIYDGSFTDVKIPGSGVAAALLMSHGIKVYSEKEVTEELLRTLIGEKNSQ